MKEMSWWDWLTGYSGGSVSISGSGAGQKAESNLFKNRASETPIIDAQDGVYKITYIPCADIVEGNNYYGMKLEGWNVLRGVTLILDNNNLVYARIILLDSTNIAGVDRRWINLYDGEHNNYHAAGWVGEMMLEGTWYVYVDINAPYGPFGSGLLSVIYEQVRMGEV